MGILLESPDNYGMYQQESGYRSVRGLLADLDDAPEEGVLVGRVGAVPLDDVVYPAVLGEIHC